MRSGFFRQMAQQCRDLMGCASTEAVKEQLQVWAEEFDDKAKRKQEQRTRITAGNERRHS